MIAGAVAPASRFEMKRRNALRLLRPTGYGLRAGTEHSVAPDNCHVPKMHRTAPMTANSAIVPPAAVAVIGLGNMGVPMGLRLIKAGFTVTGFDVSETARENFAAAGGRIAGDVAAAVAAADVVITLLPNGKIVREAVTGLWEHLKPSAIVVDMSSSDPLGTRALGDELIAAGHAFVDAPVSGGVRRAADGTLAIMVGGDDATVDRIAALLGAMGTSIFR